MQEYGHFINGRWTHFSLESSIESRNPATGEVLAAFRKGTREDVREAIQAAQNAFPT